MIRAGCKPVEYQHYARALQLTTLSYANDRVVVDLGYTSRKDLPTGYDHSGTYNFYPRTKLGSVRVRVVPYSGSGMVTVASIP